MRKAWMPPARWVFGVATVLGLFSTLQAYRLTLVNSKEPIASADVGRLLVLNLALWCMPALLMPTIVSISRRFRLDAATTVLERARALAVHLAGALGFAFVHFLALTGVRLVLWPDGGKASWVPWSAYLQRRFLENLDWSLMVYAVMVGASHAMAYYYESQDRKLKAAQLETHLVEARLKTLLAELHPHFLFNTLHAISTLVHRDPEAADRMITRLSDLLRLTFDRTGTPRVSLKEEMDFLQKYLDIEQIRFQDRLTVRVQVEPDALDAEVPRLILQPLVENAFKHGIANRTEGGFLQISAGLRADTLWMEVRDNGGGLRGRTLMALRTGVGLSNTRARLECMYPDQHRLEFADTLGGLAVRIEIPFTRAAVAPAAAAFRVA